VQVFLSYRRSDAGGHAGRLADSLAARLGVDHVFQDVQAIAPGEDFTSAIDRALDHSNAVLAVIGPGWLDAAGPEGDRRLFEPGDYVHLELARALDRGVPVVPVLVGGAALPAAGDLPADLGSLVHRQAAVLHDATWHEDVGGLVRRLEGERPTPTGRRARRRWPVAAGIGAAVVLVAGVTWWWQAGGDDTTGGGGITVHCPGPEGDGWQAMTPLGGEATTPTDPEGTLTFRVHDARWRATGERTWQVVLDMTMENGTPGAHYNGDWLYTAVVVAQREFPTTCFSASPDLVEAGRIGDATVGFDVACPPTGPIEVSVSDGTDLAVSDDGQVADC